MHCPRLDHFVKIRSPFIGNNTVVSCCHMTNAPVFADYDTMMNSRWLASIRESLSNDVFPSECIRCKHSEDIGQTSVREYAIIEDKQQTNQDYLIADVILDNTCNSACQFCYPTLSTKIGSLMYGSKYAVYDNYEQFNKLPLERITQLDLAGGEPSNSKNYKQLLLNLPPNVGKIRVNTNCSSFMDELVDVVAKGIDLQLTVSFDGVGLVHEYVRWPIKWDKFYKTLLEYKKFADETKNVTLGLWTALNTLNVNDFENILQFAKDNNISHEFSLLEEPLALNIRYKNKLTLDAKEKFANTNNSIIQSLLPKIASGPDNQKTFDTFVLQQDKIRKISIKDFIKG